MFYRFAPQCYGEGGGELYCQNAPLCFATNVPVVNCDDALLCNVTSSSTLRCGRANACLVQSPKASSEVDCENARNCFIDGGGNLTYYCGSALNCSINGGGSGTNVVFCEYDLYSAC